MRPGQPGQTQRIPSIMSLQVRFIDRRFLIGRAAGYRSGYRPDSIAPPVADKESAWLPASGCSKTWELAEPVRHGPYFDTLLLVYSAQHDRQV